MCTYWQGCPTRRRRENARPDATGRRQAPTRVGESRPYKLPASERSDGRDGTRHGTEGRREPSERARLPTQRHEGQRDVDRRGGRRHGPFHGHLGRGRGGGPGCRSGGLGRYRRGRQLPPRRRSPRLRLRQLRQPPLHLVRSPSPRSKSNARGRSILGSLVPSRLLPCPCRSRL